MKKFIAIVLMAVLGALILASCGGDAAAGTGTLHAVTRESGSGTRGAFVEIVGVSDADGNDLISSEAEVQQGTGAVVTAVSGNPQAIGYASTGAAATAESDGRIRMLPIDGVAPTTANMLSGTYAISRPFLIAYNTQAGLNELTQDFVDFIFSAQGQAVVSGSYVPVAVGAPEYASSGLTGTIVVNGSSSVYSLMQNLSEAYRELNAGVTIDVHNTGSGAGITAARDQTADLGMSSRDLRDTELEALSYRNIAIDGIAIIVHPDNDISGLTMEQVRNIFLGEVEAWEDVR